MRQFFLLPVLCVAAIFMSARPDSKDKPDNSPAARLKRDVEYLASPNTEGRLTGSKGEELAANYIEGRFKALGIPPYKSKYQWEFTTKTGMRVGNGAFFKLLDHDLEIGKEVIVLPYGRGNTLRGFTMPRVYEEGNVWMISLQDMRIRESSDPQKALYEKARASIESGASAVVFYNDAEVFQDLTQINLTNFEALGKPVCLINYQAWQDHGRAAMKQDWIVLEARLGFEDANATGHNVAAMIDNKAPFTVIVGAHYDHLGTFGGNFRGADDNASGVAALLMLAEMTKQAGTKNYNYLFIAFSGKEQGLQGSKAFLQQNEFFAPNIAAMFDLDMVGRMTPARDVYISGVGTAPQWADMLKMMNRGFVLHVDSSGYGYSDYTTFYQRKIPVLRFSTGYHDDYMKPSDEPSKVNYAGQYDLISYIFRVMGETDRRARPIFNQTNDVLSKLEKQKSDLGIIPDFSFNENGIRVAACIPNRTAAKSGMLSGDVITKIGPFSIVDFDDYMQAMRKSETGREITVIVRRGKNDYKFFVVL